METALIDVGTEELPCTLDKEAQIARGRALAAAQQELEGFRERKKKAVLATLKAEETEIVARVAKLAAVIATGEEVRNVTVEGRIDYEAGKVIYRRRDTGAVVRERGITPAERQPGLPLEAQGPETGDGGGMPDREQLVEEAGQRQAIRAELCGHLTEVPQDGSIPKLCKTCVPDGDEVAGEGEAEAEAEEAAEGEEQQG